MEPKPQRQQQSKPQQTELPELQELLDELEALRHWERNRSEHFATLVLSLSQAEQSQVVIDLQRQIADIKEEIRILRELIIYKDKLLAGKNGKPPTPPILPAQDQEEYEQQLKILKIYRHTLAHLLEQAAKYGGIVYAPPYVANVIRDVRQEVAYIKRIIREAGHSINDNFVDGDQVDTPPKQSHLSKEQEATKYRRESKAGCVSITSLIFAGIMVYMFDLFLGVSLLGGIVI
jgi:hypothetical protein